MNSSNPKIVENIIHDNLADYSGGGILCNYYANPYIYNNIIINNTVLATGGAIKGGGICCNNYSNPIISNNIICENSVWVYDDLASGGGIYCNISNPLIINNTIVRNQSNVYGGGIYCINSNPEIVNTVIWANFPNEIEGEPSPISYSNINGGAEGEGNIDANPLFIDVYNGNYNICLQSPCIDKGDPNVSDPDGSRSDIGVYFLEHPECFLGNKWNVSPDGNDSTGNGSEESPYETIQKGINMALHGDTVLINNGIYYENIQLLFKEICLTSQNIYSNDIEDIENTIIDGKSEDRVIYIAGSDSSSTINGITIKNGYSLNGGGIFIESSNSNIKNNIVTENSAYMRGGGIYCNSSDALIENNIISKNYSYIWAGGICCVNSNTTIINNIISGNSRNAGGITCYDSSPLIMNNIIWRNSSPQIAMWGGTPQVTYCDIQSGYNGEGNINEDPLFVDPHSNKYNLCINSPCIDAGHPDSLDPDGSRSDIGVFYPEHPDCFLGNKWYVSVNGDDTTGDGSWWNPFRTIQYGIDFSLHGDTVIVGQGEYHESLYFFTKGITLASDYLYSEDTVDIINTIIDGDSLNNTISIEYCDSTTSIIGFSITHGYAGWGGGVLCSNESSPIIAYNYIYGNNTGDGGGIKCDGGSNALIIGNKIWANSYFGIYARVSNPIIINNSIFNNARYGIWGHYSWLNIVNNVIYNNSPNYNGAGIVQSGEGHRFEVKNSIVRKNSLGGGVEILGFITLLYTNIEGDWPGEGNIDIDPLFRDPENGDFHLMAIDCGDPFDSPCIDMGHPDILDSLLDCDWGLGGLRSDMGAYGGGDSVGVDIDDLLEQLPKRIALFQNYPNPFNASTVIKYELPQQSQVTIEIYDILGRKVTTLIDKQQPAGYHQAIWHADDFASGMYFYKLQAGDFIETKKMILMK